MNKEFTVVILTILICCTASGQTPFADSLRTILPTTTKPMDRFRVLDELTLEMANTVGNYVDSTFCFQMLGIAQELDNDSLLAICYNWLGTYFYASKGDNATGLDYYFKGIPPAERAGDQRRVSSLYFDIAIAYFDMGNKEEAIRNTRKGGQHLPPKASPMYYYMLTQYQSNMALYFLLENKSDSALYYSKAMEETNRNLPHIALFRLNELAYTGSTYAQQGDIKVADSYFTRGKLLMDSVESAATRYQFLNQYIPFLMGSNRIAEAEEQSRMLIAMGRQNNNNPIIQKAGANFLRQVFEARHQLDSAYHYSKMETELNELIEKERNKNKFQTLAINEKIWSMEEERERAAYENQLKLYLALSGIGVFLIIVVILYRNNRQKQKANGVLQATLVDLKATQSQLVQSEKMASLGELTAGIAHEIQNPLNFVNNFSEVNAELISELQEAAAKGNLEEVKSIATIIKENESKIASHGKRADTIVKGMLQHSRTSTGQKELTDINALCDEYLRLSYHGLRAKDKSFNATFTTDFDPSLGKISVIPQEIGRVVLNLINNAFYACIERSRSAESEKLKAKSQKRDATYEPTVVVSTKSLGNRIEISVRDNGNGIPPHIKDKIFQPFFTTKPTGQGTGLGLSLSYDIVTKGHGGELQVSTTVGSGSSFTIVLPA